jgi:hypothetical protein
MNESQEAIELQASLSTYHGRFLGSKVQSDGAVSWNTSHHIKMRMYLRPILLELLSQIL